MQGDRMRGTGRPLEAIHRWPLSTCRPAPIQEELGSEQFVQFCQGVSKTHFPWFPTSRHLFPIINGGKPKGSQISLISCVVRCPVLPGRIDLAIGILYVSTISVRNVGTVVYLDLSG